MKNMHIQKITKNKNICIYVYMYEYMYCIFLLHDRLWTLRHCRVRILLCDCDFMIIYCLGVKNPKLQSDQN